MHVGTMVKGYLTAPAPRDMVYAPYDLAIDLGNELVGRGHDVDFYAPEGSDVGRARLITLGQRALATDYNSYVGRENGILFNPGLHSDNVLALHDQRYSAAMFREARRQRQNGQDAVLHFHHPEAALPYADLYPDVPVVHTLHDPISDLQRTTLETFMTPNQFFVSLSDYQRRAAPDLPYIATVYNGIDTELFRPDPTVERTDNLLFVGRIVPEKGVKEAIEVAQATGRELDIIGPTYPDFQDYFNEDVRPHLSDRIRYLGHIARRELPWYFRRAGAFLMPIQWDEPFGLVMAEAMACNTHVIALHRGSVPEVVAHGETGFVVHTTEEMAEVVPYLGTLPPDAGWARVLAHFSKRSMGGGYETVFHKAISRVAALN